MWIIIVGTFADGFEFHGPFTTTKEAIEYGGLNGEDDWSLISLIAPYAPEAHT